MEIKDLPLEIKEKAVELKKKWSSIYCIKTGEMYIIVRSLTRKEFIFFVDLAQYSLGIEEDYVFSKAVLYPKFDVEFLNDCNAGIVSSSVEQIVHLSGFGSPEDMEALIDASRGTMDLADSQIIAILCKAFPGLNIEDIDNFDAQKLAYHIALAEKVLGVTLQFQKETPNNIGSIDFADDNKNLRTHGISGNADPRTVRKIRKPRDTA